MTLFFIVLLFVLLVAVLVLGLTESSVVLLKHVHVVVLRALGNLLVIRVLVVPVADLLQLLLHGILLFQSLSLVLGFFFSCHDVFTDRLHKRFVFRHLIKRLANVLDHNQVGEVWAQLEELLQIRMFGGFLADASLLEYTEEVFCVHDFKRLLLGLALHVLMVYHVGKKLYGAKILLKQVQH